MKYSSQRWTVWTNYQDYAHFRNTSFCDFCERTEVFNSISLHRSYDFLRTPAFCILFLSYYLALTLLSSRLSKGPGGSSRQRNSLTARLYQIKESQLLEVQNQQEHLKMITKWRYFFKGHKNLHPQIYSQVFKTVLTNY